MCVIEEKGGAQAKIVSQVNTKLDIMYQTTCAQYKFDTEKQHGGHSGVSCQSEGGSVHLGECKVYCYVLY